MADNQAPDRWPMGGVAYAMAIVAVIHAHPSWYGSLALLGCLAPAIRDQRKRPLIVLFRRFSLPGIDEALRHMAAALDNSGRVVWLADASDKGTTVARRGFGVFASLAAALCAFTYAIVTVCLLPNPEGFLWAVYTVSATLACVLVFAGLAPTLLVSYYAAVLCNKPIATYIVGMLPVDGASEWAFAAGRLIVAVVVFVVVQRAGLRIMITVASRKKSPRLFRRLLCRYTVENDNDFAQLVKECRSRRFALLPRYLLNAPVLIHEVWCADRYWQASVDVLLERAVFAVIDLTDVTGEGLAWEIGRCREEGIPTFFLCRLDLMPRAAAYLATQIDGAVPPIHAWQLSDTGRILDRPTSDALLNALQGFLRRHLPG